MNSFKPYFEVKNQSSPVDIFFVHGNLASRRWWYPSTELMIKEFKANNLPQSSRFILSDLRGCGLTPTPTTEKLNLEDLIEDQIKIAEEVRFTNGLIIGHSAGGLISAIMLARRPDLFKAAILVDPVGPTGLLGVPDDIEAKYQMMNSSRDISAQVIGFTIHNNDASKAFFQNEIMDDAMTALKNTGISLVRALEKIDYSSEISKITQPVSIYHGAHDWVLDEGRATDHHKLMKNSQFIKLPNNGHCMIYENPERLAIDVCEFIKINFSIFK